MCTYVRACRSALSRTDPCPASTISESKLTQRTTMESYQRWRPPSDFLVQAAAIRLVPPRCRLINAGVLRVRLEKLRNFRRTPPWPGDDARLSITHPCWSVDAASRESRKPPLCWVEPATTHGYFIIRTAITIPLCYTACTGLFIYW